MAADVRIKRGSVAGLPTGADGEPLFTTDQYRLYVGHSSANRLVGVLDKIDATVPPDVNDDAGDGYSVGSQWVDTSAGDVFVCVDASVGAAVWEQTNGAPGGAGTVTDFIFTDANGVDGTVTNSTTTPTLEIALTDITPTTVNGITLSGSSTPTLSVTGTSAVSGTNTGDQLAWKTIAVSGQSDVVADTIDDTLTFVAGTNVTITTDGVGSVTINASGGGGGSVTSVDMTVPTGFSVSGNPVTTTGTLAITITGDVDFNGFAVANIADPVSGHQAATKSYVDTNFQPLDATLTALAAENWRADALPIGTGSDTMGQVDFGVNTFPAKASSGPLEPKTITDFGLALVEQPDATDGRTALGATTVGANLFTLANPSAIRFIRINADNSVSTRTAAQMLSDIGAGSGSGTVTNFSAGDLSPLFTTSEATTTTTPALTFTAVNQNANIVYAGPASGSAAAPTFRALVALDLPTIGLSKGGTNADLSATGPGVLRQVTAGATVTTGQALDYIVLRDEKTSGTNGGTATSGSWETRTLNTEAVDTGSHCTLSSNQFALLAGTYRIRAIAQAGQSISHQAKLRNVTDSADVILGTSQYCSPTANYPTHSEIVGRFTIAATKTFEIQHRVGQTLSGYGYGIACSFGTEVYTIVELWREVG